MSPLGAALVATSLAQPAIGAAQQPVPAVAAAVPSPVTGPDSLRGRVTTDSGTAVSGAQVIVTMGPERIVQRTATDPDGRWALVFANGTGDFLVYVSFPGRQPFRRRVTRGMPGFPAVGGRDAAFTVDVVLKPAAPAQLASVSVRASRPRPDRRGAGFGPGEPDVGAAERPIEGVAGAIPPDAAGDLAAQALTTPGVLGTAGGVSALGLGPTQTNVTLGGLAFGGTELPRDARTQTRVTTSTYDPARGWFGGAQIAVELAPGNSFGSRRSHLTLDAPALQATDQAGTRLGQRASNVQASVGGDGPTAGDNWTYNYGAQASRRVADAPSLLDAPAGAFAAAGLAPDSAERLRAVARRTGIPIDAVGMSSGAGARVTDQASFVARIDKPLLNYRTFEPTRRTYGLTAFGSWRRGEALGVTPLAAPASGASQTSVAAGVQGVYSAYLGRRDWLLDVRTGLSAGDDRRDPYLRLPSAQVLVGSAPPAAATTPSDGDRPALVPVALGGNAALASRRRTTLWETLGELRLYTPQHTRHRLTVTADARLDALREDPAADRLGTYSYPSLTAFDAGRPSTFGRALNAPGREASVWNGFLAAGDYWRPSDRLQVMYGGRLEANRFTSAPDANAALEQALGIRTDRVPNTVGFSPRAGFTWVRARSRTQGYTVTPLGTFRTGAPSILRGGIGMFRNLLGPDVVAASRASTGLPDANQRLLCVGSAVPAPDWEAWGAGVPVPTACAPGTASFSDAAPGILAFDRAYTAPRSWRGNLSWASSRWGLAYSLEGVYSYNLNQPGTVQGNFVGAPRFTLAGEGRPVYVSAASIDPASGAVSSVESRRDLAFGRVALQRSDLRSVSRQVTLSLAPAAPQLGRWVLAGAYTLGQVRQQFRGFDGATFGDPATREWARGDFDVRHQFLTQAGYRRGGVSLTLFGRVQSGVPYTPLVGADVNGDGLLNDRAFVFAPSTAGVTSAPARDAATRSLLASAPAPVRDCLRRTVGTAAPRNGCEGPWTATLNARIGLEGNVTQLGRRVHVGLNFANPLGGLDQLLHGERARGWGAPALPDPVLYRVAGFDAAAQRFRYEVNPRFGDTRPQATTVRAPFRLTLDVSLDLGRPVPEQQLDRWLQPGRGGRPGPRLSAADLKRRYVRNVPDPYRAILQESDSLLLTREQAEALEAAQSRYRQRADSAWEVLAEDFAALDNRYDAGAALKRQEATVDAVWELTRRDVQAVLPQVLSPIQQRLAPWPAGLLLRAREPVHIRVFTGG